MKEGRQTNRQMYRKSNVQTFCASYGTYRQTDRLTDRTEKHRKTNRLTDR